MSDYRNAFLKTVEQSLVSVLSAEDFETVIGTVTKVLNDYEITERCTDLVPLKESNAKLLKRYCACLMVDGKSSKTIAQYARSAQKLSDFLNKDYVEMTAYDIRYFLACEKQRGIANTTLENYRSQFSAFFHWMSLEDIIPKNIMELINVIKCPVEIKKPFSEVEIDALRSACENERERALIEFLLSSGVRVEELSEMEIDDIDLARMSVEVKHGKGNKSRVTYMSSICSSHMRAYLNGRKDDKTSLFLNKNKGKLLPGGIRYVLNTIADRAGVENTHPHRFRRTFATNLAARGMDIQEIQRLMGHSKIDTTMRYINVDDTRVAASYKRYIA